MRSAMIAAMIAGSVTGWTLRRVRNLPPPRLGCDRRPPGTLGKADGQWGMIFVDPDLRSYALLLIAKERQKGPRHPAVRQDDGGREAGRGGLPGVSSRGFDIAPVAARCTVAT